MQMGERDRELLASLCESSAYRVLVKLFTDFESDVLGLAARTGPDKEMARRFRFYQFVRSVREFLEKTPQNVQDELLSLQQQSEESAREGEKSQEQLWYERFSAPHPVISDTD